MRFLVKVRRSRRQRKTQIDWKEKQLMEVRAFDMGISLKVKNNKGNSSSSVFYIY